MISLYRKNKKIVNTRLFISSKLVVSEVDGDPVDPGSSHVPNMTQGDDRAALFDIGIPLQTFGVLESIDKSRRNCTSDHIRFRSSGNPLVA